MKDLKIDPLTNDLAFDEAVDLDMIESAEETGQHMTTELGTDRGEHAITTSFGVPYFDVVFVKNPDLGLITSLLKGVISKRSDVREVVSFVPDFDGTARFLEITFEAETDEGLVAVSLEI